MEVLGTNKSILTIKETAMYLNVPIAQVYALVRCEGFPSFKVGKHWRIAKDKLDEWVLKQIEDKAI